jgi:hypothetical protein
MMTQGLASHSISALSHSAIEGVIKIVYTIFMTPSIGTQKAKDRFLNIKVESAPIPNCYLAWRAFIGVWYLFTALLIRFRLTKRSSYDNAFIRRAIRYETFCMLKLVDCRFGWLRIEQTLVELLKGRVIRLDCFAISLGGPLQFRLCFSGAKVGGS